MSEKKFYPIRNDYMFKAVMQRSPEVLRNLIAAMLGRPVESITACELKNPIILGETIDEKMVVLDVKVELDGREIIDLEMQNYQDKDWVQRSVFYSLRSSISLDAGDNYGKIKPVYVMGFLNFTPLADNPQFYSEYTFLDTITHKRYSELASIRIVDMTRIEEARDVPLEQEVAKWAAMFAANSLEELERLAEGDEILKEMVFTFAELSEEEKIRQQCMAREDYYRRQAGMKRQGVEEGIEIGKDLGIIIGRNETLLALVKDDLLSASEAAKRVGISEEEIAKMIDNMA